MAGIFGLQFYAAIPLKTKDGFNIGTFCIIDKKRQYFNSEQQDILRDMAGIVMENMELRLQARQAARDYLNTNLAGLME